MKMNWKLALAAAAAVAGLGLFIAVFAVGRQHAGGHGGPLRGASAGRCWAWAAAGLFLPLAMRAMTPEQRKEAERSERDERSIFIRQARRPEQLVLDTVPAVDPLCGGPNARGDLLDGDVPGSDRAPLRPSICSICIAGPEKCEGAVDFCPLI